MPGILNSYTEIFKPKIAIIAYEGHQERAQEWYLESHTIENGELLEGKPLQQETFNQILALMYNKQQAEIKINKFIPYNLLHYDLAHGGDYKLIWYRPEERRMLYFASQFEVPNGESWVPTMLYVATKKTLSVFALKSNDYPTEETKLCRAPYRNVYGNGKVCLGSARAQRPQSPSFQTLMKYHEDLFWGSEFSSGSEIWKKMINTPDLKWSDIPDELKPATDYPRTIKDLIK